MTKRNSPSEYSLTHSDVQAIINATKTIRDKVIIEILAYTGCRRLELVLLRICDINLSLSMIDMPTVKQDKGVKLRNRDTTAYSNIRRIPIINDDLKRDLATYLELLRAKRTIHSTDRLIQSRQNKSITEPMINNIVKSAAKNAGVRSPNPDRKQVHPHMFRHTFVRYAKKKGVDYSVIQHMVGHAHMSTTFDMYGKPSWEDKVNELSKMKDLGEEE